MADDNEKKTTEEPARKKALPAIVLVAAGAALGGAGTVFLLPQAPAEQHEPTTPQPEYRLLESPDVVRLHFNPRQERGSMMAKLEFHFVYKLDINRQAEVNELIKNHWNQMFSRVLLRVRRETPQALRDPDAVAVLENDIIEEMSLSLFPSGEAVVEQLVWKSFYLQ